MNTTGALPENNGLPENGGGYPRTPAHTMCDLDWDRVRLPKSASLLFSEIPAGSVEERLLALQARFSAREFIELPEIGVGLV